MSGIKEKIQQIIEEESERFDFTTDPRIDVDAQGRANVAIINQDVMGDKFFSFIESLKVKFEEEHLQVEDSGFFYSYYLIRIKDME